MPEKQPNRLTIKNMIEEGNCTKESIEEALGISRASLATNFSYLRMMGHFPIQDAQTKILSFVSEDDWNRMKEERALNGVSRASEAKTPAERLTLLRKKLDRVTKAFESAQKRSQDDDDKLLALKSDRCEIDVQITEIELRRHISEHGEEEVGDDVEASDKFDDTEDEDELV